MTISEICEIATLVISTGALLLTAYNSRQIKDVHTLTNSLATRTEALARSTGMAEGELKGRAEARTEAESNKPT